MTFDLTITPLIAADLPGLAGILDRIELFPSEMLADLTAGHLAGAGQDIWLVAHIGTQPVGLCYATPEALADRVWNMLALGVDPDHHRSGVAAALTTALLDHLCGQGARLLIVDTSGAPDYAGARAFYLAQGFAGPVCLPDYWAEGDDRLTFSKRL